MTQFQLTQHREGWYVTILHPNPIVGPVYLGHSTDETRRLSWFGDWQEAKPFMQRRAALQYVLENTKLKVYRQPYGKRKGYIEVDFDRQVLTLNDGGTTQTLTFPTYRALLSLPLHANALEPEHVNDNPTADAQT